MEEEERVEEKIEGVVGVEEEGEKRLKEVKREMKVEKMKGGGVKGRRVIGEGVSCVLGGRKVKRVEGEKENLKGEIVDVEKEVEGEEREERKMEKGEKREIMRIEGS